MWIEPAAPVETQSDALQDLDDALAWCGRRIARDMQERATRGAEISSQD